MSGGPVMPEGAAERGTRPGSHSSSTATPAAASGRRRHLRPRAGGRAARGACGHGRALWRGPARSRAGGVTVVGCGLGRCCCWPRRSRSPRSSASASRVGGADGRAGRRPRESRPRITRWSTRAARVLRRVGPRAGGGLGARATPPALAGSTRPAPGPAPATSPTSGAGVDRGLRVDGVAPAGGGAAGAVRRHPRRLVVRVTDRTVDAVAVDAHRRTALPTSAWRSHRVRLLLRHGRWVVDEAVAQPAR